MQRTAFERPALVCHFFFKKGEQDIQNARTALESILYQILSSNSLRRSTSALIAAVEVLNPVFGESDFGSRGNNDDFLDNLEALSDAIRRIAETVQDCVVLMIDALDECVDRREQNLTQHLKSIINGKPDGLRIIISARDSFDCVNELSDPQTPGELDSAIKVIEITPDKNARDLEDYLKHDVGAVLKRRIDQGRFKDYFELELSRIVRIIHQKAKGDFTLARMIVGNLQQPSKESLEDRIQRLPAAIGEIYMQSIESLTPDEQELIVSALKWVVWSVSSLTVIEVSDHYRDVYKAAKASNKYIELSTALPNSGTKMNSGLDVENQAEASKNLYAAEAKKLISEDPYEDPEIKDIMYHLEDAGRDFFRFDRNTGLVSVDISIREWIQEDVPESSATQESRGFNKYRDPRGNTVFRFTLTPSFVRYGDSLAELFSKREAHMSIALNILRALNNEAFQKKYMPWRPEWIHSKTKHDATYENIRAVFNRAEFDNQAYAEYSEKEYSPESKERQRYEIKHWQDHIRILQTWWNEGSRNDSWWTELLTQLSIFMRPENWSRWNLQRGFSGERSELAWYDNATARLYEDPIHTASEFGLHLIVDHLVQETGNNSKLDETYPRRESDIKDFRLMRVVSLVQSQASYSGKIDYELAIKNASCEEVLCSLNHSIKNGGITLFGVDFFAVENLQPLLELLEHTVLVAWLASQTFEHLQRVEQIYSHAAENGDPDLETDVNGFLQRHHNDKDLIHEKLEQLAYSIPVLKPWDESICGKPDAFGQVPLYIAARYPATVEVLLKHGVDVNAVGKTVASGVDMYGDTPLMSILLYLTNVKELPHDVIQSYLQSAKALISEGAKLDVKSVSEATVLHLAAKIRDLKFFKLLGMSWEWDVHAVDSSQMNPLHFLFQLPAPKDANRAKEVLDICQIIIKMRRGDVGDIVNAEDHNSEMPLAGAVRGGFKEAVELLIDLGADIHDDNDRGQNYFHVLAGGVSSSDETEVAIANTFFNAGLECSKPDNEGHTPIALAVENSQWNLVHFFLQKYDELGKQSPDNNPLLWRDEHGRTLLHILITGSKTHEDDSLYTELFKTAIAIFSDHVKISDFIVEKDFIKETPLHVAIQYRREGIVKLIMDINSDISHRNIIGFTPLDLVAEKIAIETNDVVKGLQAYLAETFGTVDGDFSRDREIFYSHRGEVYIDGEWQTWKENPHFELTDFSGSYFFPVKNPSFIGCGINPLQNVVFYTVNGKVVPVAWAVPPRRYLPYLQYSADPEGVKFNFGSEPFGFTPANDPGWKWDGSFENTDTSDDQIYWSGNVDVSMQPDEGNAGDEGGCATQ
ncbi:Ankyrin-2 [Dactylellina cionopaga]|nr:Ankyrin-2 [Dactylellina cionopaga]